MEKLWNSILELFFALLSNFSSEKLVRFEENMYFCSKTYTKMNKRILTFLLTCFLIGIAPTVIVAGTAIELTEPEWQQTTISLQENNILHVTGASGQTLHIYNVAGVRVLSIKVDGPDRRFELNLPKGCYIVKAGKTVRKISVR